MTQAQEADETNVIPDNAAELANAPILGLLAVIVIILLLLLGLAIRLMIQQGNDTSETLQREVDRLNGRLDETTRRLDQALDRAIRAEYELAQVRGRLEDVLRDLDASTDRNQDLEAERDLWRQQSEGWERKFKALKAEIASTKRRVKQLEAVLRERGIEIPVSAEENNLAA